MGRGGSASSPVCTQLRGAGDRSGPAVTGCWAATGSFPASLPCPARGCCSAAQRLGFVAGANAATLVGAEERGGQGVAAQGIWF